MKTTPDTCTAYQQTEKMHYICNKSPYAQELYELFGNKDKPVYMTMCDAHREIADLLDFPRSVGVSPPVELEPHEETEVEKELDALIAEIRSFIPLS